MKICILADENKKEAAARLCTEYCGTLCRHSVCATVNVASYIEEITGLPVTRLLSCDDGAVEQVTGLCVCGEADTVIYLRDSAPGVPDFRGLSDLVRTCDFYGIPVATGIATAEILLHSVSRRDNARFLERLSGSRTKN